MKNYKHYFVAVIAAFLLAACQSTPPVETTPNETVETTDTTAGLGDYDNVEGTVVDPSSNGLVRDAYGNIIGEMVNGVFVPCEDCPQAAGSGPEDPLSITTIYFDYDQTSIKPEYLAVLEAHANNVATSGLQLRLEGHADERGSREYNIGLGERRAQAVKRAMMLSGANSTALATVSYGEEQPLVSGSDEASFAQNRRVELVYR